MLHLKKNHLRDPNEIKETALITIAIPTWNRCKSLEKALDALLPQVNEFKENVQVIISDNGSNDGTEHIIKRAIENYPDLNIVANFNLTNTGHYGNFKKCKELTSGKYFWLLSDDDFVELGVIKKVIENISYSNPSLVFLNGWGNVEKKRDMKVSSNVFLSKFGVRSTLVSTCIILNNTNNDEVIFKDYFGSAFLCYAFVINSLVTNFDKEVVVINSPCLNVNQTGDFSFDPFSAFIEQINDCIGLLKTNPLATKSTIRTFRNHIFKEILLYHLLRYKLGVYSKSKYDYNNLNKRLIKYYGTSFSFWIYGIPLIIMPSIIVSFMYKVFLNLRDKS